MAATQGLKTRLGACWLGLAALACAPTAAALQVCVGDVPVPPFLSGDPSHPGITERLLLDAGRQVGLPIELLRWPARRCFEQMRLGLVEAGIGAAIPANLQEFDFPGGPQQADPQLRIARAAIVLVKRHDQAIDWDGQRLTASQGGALRIGARAGFRAGIEAVRRLGLELSPGPGPNQSLQLLRMLQLGRLDLAVLVQDEADTLLARREFSGLRLMEPPLLVSDFYIMTIRQLPEPQRQLVRRWWEQIAQWRDLPAYRPTTAPP